MLSQQVRELEERNAALTASYAAVRSVLVDIAGGDADPMIDMRMRMGLIRHLAEDLSAGAFNLTLESPYIVDHVLASRLDQVGESLRRLLDGPMCTCGEHPEEEQ